MHREKYIDFLRHQPLVYLEIQDPGYVHSLTASLPLESASLSSDQPASVTASSEY